MSNAVIVPTIRPDKFIEFLDGWKHLFQKHNCLLYIVEDNPSRTKEISKALKNSNLQYEHYCHKDLPWFIPTHTDMIRSYGILKAYKNIMNQFCFSFDDDVLPIGGTDPIQVYLDTFSKGGTFSKHFPVSCLTNSGSLYMRGFPFSDRYLRTVAVQYGGWVGNLDYGAVDQFIANQRRGNYDEFSPIIFSVPAGSLTTCCSMNMAWTSTYSPIMWQLPIFEGRYNRVGDIWSGLFIKKVLDQLEEVMVINGRASVEHLKASDPFVNIKKEVPSLELNDKLWKEISDFQMSKFTSMFDSYEQITNVAFRFFSKHDVAYANTFIKCRDAWLDACSGN